VIGMAVRDDDVFQIGDLFADRFDRRDDFVLALRQPGVDERQLALIEEKRVHRSHADLPEAFDDLSSGCHAPQSLNHEGHEEYESHEKREGREGSKWLNFVTFERFVTFVVKGPPDTIS